MWLVNIHIIAVANYQKNEIGNYKTENYKNPPAWGILSGLFVCLLWIVDSLRASVELEALRGLPHPVFACGILNPPPTSHSSVSQKFSSEIHRRRGFYTTEKWANSGLYNVWCHASAWYFPMASHLSEKNPKGSHWPRRSCMICPIPPLTWSSTLPCSIPGFPNTSGFTAPPPAPQGLCTVCLLCLEHSLPRYLWAPSHLSGLCSNISIWVKPL